ncbi:tyrosine-protein phosphatase [Nocardioides acrostichi]|uniref:Tyrosine-protein phosphatase n=1 Tax=Nocardioides acrostichi TaxID=2784339 RepID=A0A930UWV2_9ACTN|nr:tyrosine-protein phosphatase [Nocardioides acrostichi]MBF4161142.1 tyrosine-protein phosphatase [Nocardioides acrostichi]
MTTPDADQVDEGSELVRLASADNFRDVAGDGYLTGAGVALRTGVLFRSNELQLSDADAHRIASLGVVDVFDLRGADEIEAHPDIDVPGATWHHVEVAGIPMLRVAELASREEAEQVMRAVYRAFVEAPGARAAYGELLRRIADADGAQLFHCTAGKDRTGWASVLLLRLAGVPEQTVREDYLETNAHAGTREKYVAMIREHLGEEKVPVYEAVMLADLDYVAAADAAVVEMFGDLDTYVREGLGVDDATRARVVARLLP